MAPKPPVWLEVAKAIVELQEMWDMPHGLETSKYWADMKDSITELEAALKRLKAKL